MKKNNLIFLIFLLIPLALCRQETDKALKLTLQGKFKAAEKEVRRVLRKYPNSKKALLIATALNPAKYGLIKIKGGVFKMGQPSPDIEKKDKAKKKEPVHQVKLSGFYIGRFEVTNLAFWVFLERYGTERVKRGKYYHEKMFYGSILGLKKNSIGFWDLVTKEYAFHPAVKISWFGANEFCKFYGGQLPTEAQWEYVAKGGRKSKNYKYAGSNNIYSVAWFFTNAYFLQLKDTIGTKPVGLKQANELGTFDMSGNVSEWCNDWYEEGYYQLCK